MIPIKHTAHFFNGAAFKPTDWGDNGLPIIRIAQLTGKPFDNYFEGNIPRFLKISDGDLLFSWSATIDAFIWYRGDAVLNQHIFKVIPKTNTEKKYLYYLIKHHAPRWSDDDAHGSTMRHIKKESLSNKVYLPDLPTQRAIADFLDRETARIDLLIKKKRRFIDVMSQKWAATVTFTLANGLDGSASKKASGVSWVGEIPAHWEVYKLGHIGRSANGINIGGDAFGSGFPFVSYGDVYRNNALPKVVKGLVQSSAEDRARYALNKGDVLFTRTSEVIEEIGFSSVCMEDMPDAVFSGFLIRFRPKAGKMNPLFSKYFFRDQRLRAFFSREMMIVTRASLSQGLLQRMPVVLPPLNEQEQIADYLQQKENVFLTVSRSVNASIDRLKEYRSTLITAAVTGQINVAEWSRAVSNEGQLDAIQAEMDA